MSNSPGKAVAIGVLVLAAIGLGGVARTGYDALQDQERQDLLQQVKVVKAAYTVHYRSLSPVTCQMESHTLSGFVAHNAGFTADHLLSAPGDISPDKVKQTARKEALDKASSPFTSIMCPDDTPSTPTTGAVMVSVVRPVAYTERLAGSPLPAETPPSDSISDIDVTYYGMTSAELNRPNGPQPADQDGNSNAAANDRGDKLQFANVQGSGGTALTFFRDARSTVNALPLADTIVDGEAITIVGYEGLQDSTDSDSQLSSADLSLPAPIHTELGAEQDMDGVPTYRLHVSGIGGSYNGALVVSDKRQAIIGQLVDGRVARLDNIRAGNVANSGTTASPALTALDKSAIWSIATLLLLIAGAAFVFYQIRRKTRTDNQSAAQPSSLDKMADSQSTTASKSNSNKAANIRKDEIANATSRNGDAKSKTLSDKPVEDRVE